MGTYLAFNSNMHNQDLPTQIFHAQSLETIWSWSTLSIRWRFSQSSLLSFSRSWLAVELIFLSSVIFVCIHHSSCSALEFSALILSHSSAWCWRDPSASALINDSSFRNSATRALIDSSEQPIEMIRSIDFPAWSFFLTLCKYYHVKFSVWNPQSLYLCETGLLWNSCCLWNWLIKSVINTSDMSPNSFSKFDNHLHAQVTQVDSHFIIFSLFTLSPCSTWRSRMNNQQ